MMDFEIIDGKITKYNGTSEIVIIPEGVIAIGMRAFAENTAKTIILPEGLEKIESFAFVNMKNLSSVFFPKSIKKIGVRAFGDCKHLATDFLKLPPGAEIEKGAFQGCCKHSYKEVTCDVCYHIGVNESFDTITIDLFDDDSIDDVIQDSIQEYVQDNVEFDELIQDAIEAYSAEMKADGTIDIEEINRLLYDTAYEYIDNSNLGMSVKSHTNNDSVETTEIDIVTILKDRIEERSISEQSYCDVGGKVESLIQSFEKNGKWFWAFILPDGGLLRSLDGVFFDPQAQEWKNGKDIVHPLIWFGSEDTPMNLWTIGSDISVEQYEFWFTDSDDAIQYVVPDSNECFETWYYAECGRYFPVVSDIMDMCPIHFEEDDTTDVVCEKINTFFSNLLTHENESC